MSSNHTVEMIESVSAVSPITREQQKKLVNLVGTEVWGVQREGEIATSVVYSGSQKIAPDVRAINCHVYDAKEMVTDMVCRLSASWTNSARWSR